MKEIEFAQLAGKDNLVLDLYNIHPAPVQQHQLSTSGTPWERWVLLLLLLTSTSTYAHIIIIIIPIIIYSGGGATCCRVCIVS